MGFLLSVVRVMNKPSAWRAGHGVWRELLFCLILHAPLFSAAAMADLCRLGTAWPANMRHLDGSHVWSWFALDAGPVQIYAHTSRCRMASCRDPFSRGQRVPFVPALPRGAPMKSAATIAGLATELMSL